MSAQPGFFDLSDRYEQLSKHNDPLERLNETIDWNIFSPLLKKAFKKERKNAAGRKPIPRLLMFKVLVLQSLYNLSDAQTEYQIRDRLSFMRFLNLNLEDRVPDEKTIWAFREQLIIKNTYNKLFRRFETYLTNQGYQAQKGTVVDASIIPAKIQRNSDDETAAIKEGCIPEDWVKNPNKVKQKDIDARWTMKDKRSSYGYKNHIAIDVKHKLIRSYEVTHAARHDSFMLPDLVAAVKGTSRKVYADRAYRDKKTATWLEKNSYEGKIPYQRKRGGQLTERQKKFNKTVSSTRIRVEHVFGFMKQSMKQNLIRSIGIVRAEAKLSLVNLVYNLSRFEQLQRLSCA